MLNPRSHTSISALLLAAPALLAGPIGCGGTGEISTTPEPTEAPSGTLIDAVGELAEGDLSLGSAFADHFETEVRAGDRITVELTSSAFDPVVEVTPPGGQPILNDDHEGDRTRSRVELEITQAGSLKVRVTSYGAGASGAYQLRVERDVPTDATADTEALAIQVGQTARGHLMAGDSTMSDGAFYDSFVVEVTNQPLALRFAEGSTPLRVEVVDPSGRPLSPNEQGLIPMASPGVHRVLVATAAPGSEGEYNVSVEPGQGGAVVAQTHHQLPAANTGTTPEGEPANTLTLGQRVTGRLDPSDPTLPSGEMFDAYELQATAGSQIELELTSSAIDTYLVVDGEGGFHEENDDSAGTTNSRITLSPTQATTYRIIATSYRPGERGEYELKALDRSNMNAGGNVAVAPPVTNSQNQTGTLAAGDSQLQSGEFMDGYEYDWTSGQRVVIEVNSGEFDTYVMVRTPSGQQHYNDDVQPGNTNSRLEFQASETGRHQMIVTSYRPGETGSYQVAIQTPGAGTPSPNPNPNPNPNPTPPVATGDATALEVGRRIRERLSRDDQQNAEGRYTDVHRVTIPSGESLRFELNSTAFDTYLAVQAPSGDRSENDDVTSGNLNSAVEIPRTEAGVYVVTVTSYAPGDTGAYTLSLARGPSIVGPTTANNGQPSSGGNVYGVFAGITDYPPGVGDLPECANDAVKLAETLRNANLLAPANQVVLTDGQATRANVRQAMQQMAQRVGPDDVFIFFYSGHGSRDTSRPTQDRREIDGADEYLVLYDGEMIDDDLGTMFDGINANLSMLALDACFAGGFAKDVITRPGRVGYFSSEEDVTSAVANAFQAGGYLSHFLRTGISGVADDSPSDSILTVGELSRYLRLQFAHHVRDVRMSEGFQHLVVDRGAVSSDQVMWSYR